MNRRTELLTWIESTKRLQRRMAYVFAALGVITIGLAIWRATIGGFALVLLALVALCAFWITESHNAAHRQKLDELARLERNRGRPVQTGHRRWRTS